MYIFFMSLKQKDGSFMVALMFGMLSYLSFLQVEFIIFYSGIFCLLLNSLPLVKLTKEVSRPHPISLSPCKVCTNFGVSVAYSINFDDLYDKKA
jgi:hypothetical protein